jgi:hypothetical protein
MGVAHLILFLIMWFSLQINSLIIGQIIFAASGDDDLV